MVIMSVTFELISDEIEERKARIDKIKMDLIKEEAVLEYLVSKTKNLPFVAKLQQAESVKKIDENQVAIDLSKFSIPTATNTLPADVWSVVSKFGPQEFSAPLTYDVMVASGYTVSGNTPKGRISVELAKLAEAKKITRTFEGKGSTPHRYVLA